MQEVSFSKLNLVFHHIFVGRPDFLVGKLPLTDYILVKGKSTKRICIFQKGKTIPKEYKRLKYGSDKQDNLKPKYVDYPVLMDVTGG